MIGLSQRHLPDNIKHSQDPDIRASGGIAPAISASETTNLHFKLCGHRDRPFWHFVDTKYSLRLSFRALLCNSLKCLFASGVQKSEFGARETGYGWEFIMYKSVCCKKVEDCLYFTQTVYYKWQHKLQIETIVQTTLHNKSIGLCRLQNISVSLQTLHSTSIHLWMLQN